jgi:hypothetical protein
MNALYAWLKEKNVRHFHLFKYGRVALREGLRLLKVKSILIPDYLCSCIIPEIRKVGCDIRYYRIKKDMSIDFEDLARKKADAILAVNYFGFPADLKRIKEVAHGAYLVEDNAHGFLSEVDGKLLGTRGDIGISCPRKTFPVPDGAILYLNEDCNLTMENSSLLSDYKNRVLSSSVGRHIDRRIRFLVNRVIPDNYEGEMTSHSLHTINRMDFYRVRKSRRENYLMLMKHVKGVRVPFKDLGEAICPLAFPFISQTQAFGATNWANRKNVWILPITEGKM